jgi:8-oxo-dGTP pyrophosphatase MutT (NUDIX family)
MGFEAFTGDPEAFRRRVVERLEDGPVDFVEQMQFVEEKQRAGERFAASAVLLPLELDPSGKEVAVILNKRSVYVQQAGDLCFPGGGTDRRLDGVLSRLLAWGILPTGRSGPLRKLIKSSPRAREVFLLVLAGVLRESWEEMRLPPWKVEYMGPLPTLWMQSFPRVIFPVVGTVRPGWKARPNWEVESVLRRPLRALFDPENYAICKFLIASPSDEGQAVHEWEYPCMVMKSGAGEEILWGATFKILMNFMERVFDLSVAKINPSRRVVKELSPYYFSGKPRP